VSVNPTDLLSQRHKPYRQAQERYQRAAASRATAQQRVAELESELAAAEGRDRISRGDALVDGRRPGRSEADSIRPRLEEAKRDAEDLAYAEQRAATALSQLPLERKREWLSAATRSLGQAQTACTAAINELARARDQLSDEAVLFSFLQNDGQHSQPIGAGIQRPMSDGTVQTFDFSQLIELMHAEVSGVEEKALLDPNRPQPEPAFHLMQKSWG
jgi:hypothetical protein